MLRGFRPTYDTIGLIDIHILMADNYTKFNLLKEEMEKPKTDLSSGHVKRLLNDCKIVLISYPFLTPEENTMTQKDRLMCREILEYDAIISIKTKNFKEFSRVMTQLKTCYLLPSDLPKSTRVFDLLTAYFLRLLAMKDFVTFNLELAKAREVLGDCENFNYSLELYQAILDNSLTRVFVLQGKTPNTLFSILTEELLEGARQTYAECIQDSYNNVTVMELATLLRIKDLNEAKKFIQAKGWKLTENDTLVEFKKLESKKKDIDQAARYVDLAVQISAYQ